MKNYQVEVVYKMPNGSQAKVSVHVTASSASEAERQARGRVTGTVISTRAKEMRQDEYSIYNFSNYPNMLCNKRRGRMLTKNNSFNCNYKTSIMAWFLFNTDQFLNIKFFKL